MSDNKINTLGRIDQAIRGINSDGTDDGYIPPQSENGALERIEKSIKDIDIKGIKNNYKVLQTGEGHAEDYPMLISPNYQFKPSIRDKVFFESSITYNPVAQGMKIASHNDGPGEHVKMRAPFASIHEDNPQPAFIELGSDSVKATLKKDDLVLTGEGNTWDGEHGSLKAAFAGASGGPTRTVLWETDLDDNPKVIRINGTADTKMLRLSDTIDNYDVIEVYAGNIDGDSQFYSTPMQAFDTDYILRPNPSNAAIGQPMKIESILAGHIDRFNYYVVLNDNDSGALNKKVIIANTADVAFYESMIIAKIIGVKY